MAKKDTEKSAQSATRKKNPRAILIAVLVLVVVAVTAVLVYRNNQQSKATHAEFAATQEEFGVSEKLYKQAAQNLVKTADECEKSYAQYNLCSTLATAHKEIEADYAAVKEEVDAIDSNNEESLDDAITKLKASVSTVKELESKANDSVASYEKSLLQSVQDEHSTLVDEVCTNLKEAKALLSVSEGKTSDEDLWKVFSSMLDVHSKEVDKNTDVKGEDVDAYIAASEILRVENAAIVSTMNHLKEIYDNGAKASNEPSADASQTPKDDK